MQEHLLEEEHIMFRDAVREFCKKEIEPHYERWEKAGQVDRELWVKAAELGMTSIFIPEEYGGMGLNDYRYNAIISEEMARVNGTGPGIGIQNDIVTPYLLTYLNDEQKKRVLPKVASGEWIGALAMTEPVAGSDLQSIRTTCVKKGDHYIMNGSKTFISNGIMCDFAVTAVKTDPELGHKGMSMVLAERTFEGFSSGKNLDKIGMKGQDTAELFFDNMKLPVENILGDEGKGFYYLMNNLPQERMSIAISGCANAEAVLEWTMQYCHDRKAFGKEIGKFQNTRFKLAEMKTELTIARTFVDACILELNAKTLTPEKAAMAKYWVSDLQCKVCDECLQLHGGYGYMNEYAVARAYRDARVQRIYGGTNEIMKEIIGRAMGF